MKTESGQIILLLIVVMTVALAIGLSIVQKSLVDVSTASKVEQSSRAFSAAEAGIEKALTESNTTFHGAPTFADNSSQVKSIVDTGLIPCVPGLAGCAAGQQVALEYPPLAKEEVAHFWLVDPASITNPPTEFYMPADRTEDRGIGIYWGSPFAEKAAIEVKIIYYDGTTYRSAVYNFDSDESRISSNSFTNASGDCSSQPPLITIDTTSGINRSFYCKKIIDSSFPSSGLMLVRTRLLYNATVSQPVAVQGLGTCGEDCSLPPQAREIVSIGTAGETERRVKLFQQYQVVPPFFDFAIFSAGEISK